MRDEHPTFGSLFSGIGGLDLGLERAGWECRWQVELDDYCQRVLAKHWPTVPKYRDIRDVTDLPPVELVCGGFPCQPVSVAGKRLGEDDSRWLWPEFARLICLLRPPLVLLENVPGLLTRGFASVLSDLAVCGYDAEWDCLPAAAFGAPHLRRRIFVVAYANSTGLRHESGRQRRESRQGPPVPDDDDSARPLADAHTIARQARLGIRGHDEGPVFSRHHRPVPGDWLAIPCDADGVVDGIPGRMDGPRNAVLGNAVVPQVAEWIGRRLLEVRP